MDKLQKLLEQAYETANQQPQKALVLALEAEQLAYEVHDDKSLARSVLIQGICNLESNNFVKAKTFLLEVIDYANKVVDKNLLAESFLQLARASHNQGNYKTVSVNAYEALTAAREVQAQHIVGSALNLLGNSFRYFGLYEKSLDYYLQAIDIYESMDSKEVYTVLASISKIYWELGQEVQSPKYYTLSLEYLEKALTGARQHGEKRQEGECLSNLGNIYKDLGNYQKAKNYLKQAEILLKASGQESDLTTVYKTWGATYTLAGDLNKGQAYYERALGFLSTYSNIEEQIEIFLGMGINFISQKTYSLALSKLKDALELSQGQGAKPHLSEIHLYLNYAYEGLSDFAKALDHHKKYHSLKDAISQEKAMQRLEGLTAQFEVERLRKEKEISYIKQVAMVKLNQKLAQKNYELEKLNKKLEQLSIRDSLTKVFNRRYLDEYLLKEWQRVKRYKHSLSLMMSDIDNFKRINDNFSHLIGDEVLKALGKVFVENTRDSDVIARYGGEEFVVVFPETDLDQALQAAEKLRRAVEFYDWSVIKPRLGVTLSIGVAVNNGGEHYRSLLEKADKKLYQAKNNGKNRVCY